MASRNIDDLLPQVRERVKTWLDACLLKDVHILVYCTYRSAAEQADLYAQGRTAPGSIVTNAGPYFSWHNFRRAVDAIPLRAGKPMWKYDASTFEWQTYADEAEKAGLEWAGRWKSFKEYDHVQFTEGQTITYARSHLETTDGPNA